MENNELYSRMENQIYCRIIYEPREWNGLDAYGEPKMIGSERS